MLACRRVLSHWDGLWGQDQERRPITDIEQQENEPLHEEIALPVRRKTIWAIRELPLPSGKMVGSVIGFG